MSKYARAVLIGGVVGIFFSLGLDFLYAETGYRASGMPLMIVGAGVLLITAYLLSNLAGNRAGPAASADEKARVLAAQPPQGKALLYLYREVSWPSSLG